MESSRLKQSIVTGFAWVASTKLIIQIMSWFSTIIVARLLDPSDYGIVAISGIFTGILIVITDMGLSQGLINKSDVSREEEDGVFWISIILGLFSYAVMYIMAPYIAYWYDSDVLSEIIRVSSFVLIFASLKTVPIAKAMREMDFKYRAIVELLGQIASIITAITMAVNGFGVWSLVWAVIAMQVTTFLAYLPLLDRFPYPKIYFNKILEIVSYGAKLMLSRIFEFVTSKSSVFIISVFLGEKLTGHYTMAMQLANMPLDKIGSIFNSVAFPALSRAKDDDEESSIIFLKLHKYLLSVSYPIFITLFLAADGLVMILLTEKWIEIVPLLKALCAVNLLRVSGMLMPHTLAGRGKAGSVLKYELLSFIILSIAFLIGVQYGLIGVVYAWVLGYPVIYIYLLSITLMELNISPSRYIKSNQSVVISSISMLVISIMIASIIPYADVYTNTIAIIVIAPSIYILTLYMFFRSDVYEVKRIYKMIKR